MIGDQDIEKGPQSDKLAPPERPIPEFIPNPLTRETNFHQLAADLIHTVEQRFGLDLTIDNLAYRQSQEIAHTADGVWSVQACTFRFRTDSEYDPPNARQIVITRQNPDSTTTNLTIMEGSDCGEVTLQRNNRGESTWSNTLTLDNTKYDPAQSLFNPGYPIDQESYFLTGNFPETPRSPIFTALQGAKDRLIAAVMHSRYNNPIHKHWEELLKAVRPLESALVAEEAPFLLANVLDSLPTANQLEQNPEYPHPGPKPAPSERTAIVEKMRALLRRDNQKQGTFQMSDEFVTPNGFDFTPCANNPLLLEAYRAILDTDRRMSWQGQTAGCPSEFYLTDDRQRSGMGPRSLFATAVIHTGRECSEESTLARLDKYCADNNAGLRATVNAAGKATSHGVAFEEDRYGRTSVYELNFNERGDIMVSGNINDSVSQEAPRFLGKLFGILTAAIPPEVPAN